MNKAIPIIVATLVIATGVGLYFYDSSANEEIQVKEVVPINYNYPANITVVTPQNNQLKTFDLNGKLLNENEGLSNIQEEKLPEGFFPFGKTDVRKIGVKYFDFDGDSKSELIIYSKGQGVSLVKVYNCELQVNKKCNYIEIDSEQIYDDRFLSGVNVSMFYDKQNTPYLVFSPKAGGGPHVKVYKWDGKLIFNNEFFAYAPDFAGGVVTNFYKPADQDEVYLATAPQTHSAPHIRIFSPLSGIVIKQFYAGDPGQRLDIELK